MPPFSSPAWTLLAMSVFAGGMMVGAPAELPLTPVLLASPAEFRPLTDNWQLAGDLAGDPRRERMLSPVAGTGILVCNPGQDAATRGHLFTAWEHGDVELELEFLLPPGSNAGVYLQGRYEIQLFDSWGVREPTSADCGGIYARWDAARGSGRERFEGHSPRANACRAPGLWQKLQIQFRAPRFDASGRKTRNAQFVRVALNDYNIHENVEVNGPTRAAAFQDEKPYGPLMIQGDHGPLALRHLRVKRFDPGATIAVEDVHYRLFPGDFTAGAAYDRLKADREGALDRLTMGAVEPTGKFALVFSGRFRVPRDGEYQFAIESGSIAGLRIDGRTVIEALPRGGQPGVVRLLAGSHEFRLDLLHTANAKPALKLVAEGPRIAPHTLTAPDATRASAGRAAVTDVRPAQLLVEPEDRVLLQRGFVPFAPRKRLYAVSVGSPAGAHFAYDCETGAMLHVWRGSFIDTHHMWDGRGIDQTAVPAGPFLTLSGKPAIALIEDAAEGDWPDQPNPLWTAQGYTLEADGTPTFRSVVADLAICDRIAAGPEGRSLTRRLKFEGKLPGWSTWVLLAEAHTITPQPGGAGWIVGQRQWYLDWPVEAEMKPVLRRVNDRQQLAVLLTAESVEQPITYSIVW